jgi:hypothetical protein
MPQTVESVLLVDFLEASVVPGLVNDTYILIVKGEKPYINMQVRLIPRVYVVQPEYWDIEVVGTLPGIGLPATEPYSVFIPLEGIRGTIGIKVIGSDKETSIDVPPV